MVICLTLTLRWIEVFRIFLTRNYYFLPLHELSVWPKTLLYPTSKLSYFKNPTSNYKMNLVTLKKLLRLPGTNNSSLSQLNSPKVYLPLIIDVPKVPYLDIAYSSQNAKRSSDSWTVKFNHHFKSGFSSSTISTYL